MNRNLKRCCCKTKSGQACEREFIPKSGNQKYCWQHKDCKKSWCPPKTVRFGRVETRITETEPGASKRATLDQIRAKGNIIRQDSILFTCVDKILSWHNIWDYDDLNRSKLKGFEKKMVKICVKAHEGERLSQAERDTILDYERQHDDFAAKYRKWTIHLNQTT